MPISLQRLGLLDDPADARLHVGTVIADEDDERALRPAHVGERIGLAVDALEREVARLPAEVADAGLGQRHHEPPLQSLLNSRLTLPQALVHARLVARHPRQHPARHEALRQPCKSRPRHFRIARPEAGIAIAAERARQNVFRHVGEERRDTGRQLFGRAGMRARPASSRWRASSPRTRRGVFRSPARRDERRVGGRPARAGRVENARRRRPARPSRRTARTPASRRCRRPAARGSCASWRGRKSAAACPGRCRPRAGRAAGTSRASAPRTPRRMSSAGRSVRRKDCRGLGRSERTDRATPPRRSSPAASACPGRAPSSPASARPRSGRWCRRSASAPRRPARRRSEARPRRLRARKSRARGRVVRRIEHRAEILHQPDLHLVRTRLHRRRRQAASGVPRSSAPSTSSVCSPRRGSRRSGARRLVVEADHRGEVPPPEIVAEQHAGARRSHRRTLPAAC